MTDPAPQKGVDVAATMGVAVSLVGMVRARVVTVVVAITMVLVVIVGSLMGMSLPFVFTRLGWDPATVRFSPRGGTPRGGGGRQRSSPY